MAKPTIAATPIVTSSRLWKAAQPNHADAARPMMNSAVRKRREDLIGSNSYNGGIWGAVGFGGAYLAFPAGSGSAASASATGSTGVGCERPHRFLAGASGTSRVTAAAAAAAAGGASITGASTAAAAATGAAVAAAAKRMPSAAGEDCSTGSGSGAAMGSGIGSGLGIGSGSGSTEVRCERPHHFLAGASGTSGVTAAAAAAAAGGASITGASTAAIGSGIGSGLGIGSGSGSTGVGCERPHHFLAGASGTSG